MDPKDKKGYLSKINDYNAYKSTGGRLYEISVDRNSKSEFLCKGVLRLYWDIQRPIVLNKEATSKFVQKRERSSNIAKRPTSRKKEDDDKFERGPVLQSIDIPDTFDTDLSPRSSPRLCRASSTSSLGSQSSIAESGGKSVTKQVSAEMLPSSMSSSDTGILNKRSPSESSVSSSRLMFELGHDDADARSGSPYRSNSFGGEDKMRGEASKRQRTKSSLENISTHLETCKADSIVRLSPSGSSGNVTLTRGRSGSNISRMLASSFKRPKPVKTVTTFQPPVLGKSSASPKLSTSNSALPSATSPSTTTATSPVTSSPPSLSRSTSPVNEEAAASPQSKVSRKRGTSFRRGFRNPSPKRRPSLPSTDTIDSQDGRDHKEPPPADVPEKAVGRLGVFLSKPRISFKRRRPPPSTSSIDSLTAKEELPAPTSAVAAESLAEFYQPPKGSVTNIRATSKMRGSDIIAATLSKLNAVDEPTRFAIFAIDDRGTVKFIQDDELLLLYRIRLGPKEDVCKLFIMERDTHDAQDFSVEVMQYYHLGMPFLERLVQAYVEEEAREVDRCRLKFLDNRRRLEKKLARAIEELKAAGKPIPQ